MYSSTITSSNGCVVIKYFHLSQWNWAWKIKLQHRTLVELPPGKMPSVFMSLSTAKNEKENFSKEQNLSKWQCFPDCPWFEITGSSMGSILPFKLLSGFVSVSIWLLLLLVCVCLSQLDKDHPVPSQFRRQYSVIRQKDYESLPLFRLKFEKNPPKTVSDCRLAITGIFLLMWHENS